MFQQKQEKIRVADTQSAKGKAFESNAHDCTPKVIKNRKYKNLDAPFGKGHAPS